MVFDTVLVGPIETNCYLIGDESAGVCAVIDPGAEPETILDMIKKSGLRLEKILLTHGHYDHVGAVTALGKDFPDAEVLIHENDFNTLDRRLFPLHWEKTAVSFYPVSVQVGALEVKVLHTPGHSPGSVTLLVGDYMFCGDTLFALNCGRWDLPGGDMYTLMGSLADLGYLEGNYKVCPGHGEDSNLDFERKYNDYLKQAMDL